QTAIAQLQVPKWANDPQLSSNELTRRLISADAPATVQAAYRTLFNKMGPEGVHSLLAHGNDTIALRAAWEEVNLTLPQENSKGVLDVDRRKLNWFVGFFEGRARLTAPQWWKETVLGLKANRRDNVYPE